MLQRKQGAFCDVLRVLRKRRKQRKYRKLRPLLLPVVNHAAHREILRDILW